MHIKLRFQMLYLVEIIPRHKSRFQINSKVIFWSNLMKIYLEIFKLVNYKQQYKNLKK